VPALLECYARLEWNRTSDRREAERLKVEKAVLEGTVKELGLQISDYSEGPSDAQEEGHLEQVHLHYSE